MIHRGLKRFIERNDASGLSPPVSEKARNIVTFLQEMEDARSYATFQAGKFTSSPGIAKEHGA